MNCFLQVPHLIARNLSAYSSVDSVSTIVGNRFIAGLRFGAESAVVWSLHAAGLVLGVADVLACAVPRRRAAEVGAPCQRGAFKGFLLGCLRPTLERF